MLVISILLLTGKLIECSPSGKLAEYSLLIVIRFDLLASAVMYPAYVLAEMLTTVALWDATSVVFKFIFDVCKDVPSISFDTDISTISSNRYILSAFKGNAGNRQGLSSGINKTYFSSTLVNFSQFK